MSKRRMMMCGMVAVLSAVFAQVGPVANAPVGPRKELTPEVKQKIRRQIMQKTGGWIIKEGTGSGRCVFVDTQKKMPKESFSAAAEKIGALLNCKVEYEQSERNITVQTAPESLKVIKAQAAIFIIDDPTYPTTLVAPESRWAMINAAALAKDGPTQQVLAKRATREAWRVFAQLLGASNASMEGGCVLDPVSSLVELDTLKADCFCPEPLSKIIAHLRTIGVTPYVRTTYRRACEQGWAPPPTDEFQKGVWDQLRDEKERGPSRGIKIEAKK